MPLDVITDHRPEASMRPAVYLLLLTLAGFWQTADSAAPSSARNPCALLKVVEVASVLPGAKGGVVNNTREKYGITACEWDTAANRFVLQFWKNVGSSAKEEAQGLMSGVLDPLQPAAKNSVRYETITGIGQSAIAVVEKGDAARGMLNDFALLVVQHGDQIVILMAPELARVDRAKALAGLKSLGQSAVARF
jgi:hypothetical protein